MPCQLDGIDGPGGQGSGLTAQGIYPRTLTISRIAAEVTPGNVGYRSPLQTQETVIFSGLPASISFYTRGPDPTPRVPDDAVGRTLWYLMIPTGTVTTGSILRDDIATDDLERRFKVNEPLWGAIDTQIEAELLRA